jgi:hypothetical protein
MNRGIVFGLVGFALAYVIESQITNLGRDMSRYDKLRAMSGEQPFVKEQFARLLDIVTSFVGEQTSSRGVLGSIPADIVRYARISTM